ncbi:MAG: N-formylglutamate amidohydrolase [Gammaproteobacteria bacterium]|nr:N-formylglutamate amidohydrolase [Gammaproteobacteria bacterium]MCY4219342.1 N-formylglutamate amidohydrolase [Gammaproteobacteria bacterium]MCY4275853.1 N-formylglutamate amidohydrolase [Gammaproteobacteria bacterium]
MHNEAGIQPITLLGSDDCKPPDIINSSSQCPVVLVCEHAGRSIPQVLGDLGLSRENLNKHIAYDIGAKRVSMMMAEYLDAPLIMQPYSRLVIDCNRPIHSEEAIPIQSCGIQIPGNCDLGSEERRQRIEEIFVPYHESISTLLDQYNREAIFSIHSFTPVLNNETRPWDLAFLFRKDTRTSHSLSKAVREIDPTLVIGMNVPYSIDDNTDWFVPFHGEQRGLAHSLIEIRNDNLQSEKSCREWAKLLSKAIRKFLDEMYL